MDINHDGLVNLHQLESQNEESFRTVLLIDSPW